MNDIINQEIVELPEIDLDVLEITYPSYDI